MILCSLHPKDDDQVPVSANVPPHHHILRGGVDSSLTCALVQMKDSSEVDIHKLHVSSERYT